MRLTAEPFWIQVAAFFSEPLLAGHGGPPGELVETWLRWLQARATVGLLRPSRVVCVLCVKAVSARTGAWPEECACTRSSCCTQVWGSLCPGLAAGHAVCPPRCEVPPHMSFKRRDAHRALDSGEPGWRVAQLPALNGRGQVGASAVAGPRARDVRCVRGRRPHIASSCHSVRFALALQSKRFDAGREMASVARPCGGSDIPTWP